MTVKPNTWRNAGIALLLISSLLFLGELMILDAHKIPDWLTPLALLTFVLGLVLIINFLSIRQTWKTRCTEWRRTRVLQSTPGKTIFHNSRVVTISGWGWKEQIKNNLMDDFYPGDREFTLRGSWRIHPSNGNAVILYYPHKKTRNRWILEHVVCTPLGRSHTVRRRVYGAEDLNHEKGRRMLKEWSEKYVHGDEAANGLHYI
mgnify:FL=1